MGLKSVRSWSKPQKKAQTLYIFQKVPYQDIPKKK